LARRARWREKQIARERPEQTAMAIVSHDDTLGALGKRDSVRGPAPLHQPRAGMARRVLVQRASRSISADQRSADARGDVGASDSHCVSQQQPLVPRGKHHSMTLKTLTGWVLFFSSIGGISFNFGFLDRTRRISSEM